ncbi:MAG: hypothetical protein RLZZ611_1306 [Cyanobacteriota bacterium]
MACPRCGSWSIRADRSLAGRMVCGRCGTPLQGVGRGGGGGGVRPRRRRSGPAWRWWLLVLVLAAAALAAIEPGSRSFWPQPDAPRDRPHDRWQ